MTIRHGEARPASAPDARLTTSHFVDAGDARIHVLEQGSGDTTALLIPGITGTAAALGALAECLATELRVLSVDPRGRGMSSTPTEPTYSLADYTGDISTVLSELTDRPAYIVGQSMGARIAASSAVAAPEAVSGVVLLDPPLSGPWPERYPITMDTYDALLETAMNPNATAADMRRLSPASEATRPQATVSPRSGPAIAWRSVRPSAASTRKTFTSSIGRLRCRPSSYVASRATS